jgi:hypothetical protein
MELTHEAELKTLQRGKQGWAEENAPPVRDVSCPPQEAVFTLYGFI